MTCNFSVLFCNWRISICDTAAAAVDDAGGSVCQLKMVVVNALKWQSR